MFTESLIRDQLQRHAMSLGFELFGVAAAQPSPGYERLLEWLAKGYAGEMRYISERSEAYRHPESVLNSCKSVILLAMPYPSNPDTKPRKSSEELRQNQASSGQPKVESRAGRIASYASGQVDYHDLIRERLNQLVDELRRSVPQVEARGVVDTTPLLERDFARLAGIGWIGKNTLLLNRTHGSYFFLAALLVNIELPVDEAMESSHCGSCTACLDACPTRAFDGPYVLNATRCISYLTIEYRGIIDSELSRQMGDWIFGCDVCQMVCPWNRKRQGQVPEALQPQDLENKSDPVHWLMMDDKTFRRKYRKTPYWRTKLVGMQRNAMIAAANTKRNDLMACIATFESHPNEVLRNTSRECLQRLQASDR